MNTRLRWIDSWRGFLIILVVIGHVIGGGLHFTEGSTRVMSEFIFKLIYCFHMPAFFFLSGMLWHGKDTPIGQYVYGKVRRLMVPYWIFGIFSIIVFRLIGGIVPCFEGSLAGVYDSKTVPSIGQQLLQLVHAGNWPEGHGFQANSVLWFLPCMFTVQLIYYFYDKLLPKVSSQALYSIGLLIYIGVSLSRNGFLYLPFGLSLVPYYMIFFILGRLEVWKRVVKRKINEKSLLVITIILPVFYCLLCYLLPNQWRAEWSYQWRFAFVSLAVIGTISSMLYARVSDNLKFMQAIGGSTVAIMLVHKFFILAAQALPPVRRMYSLGGAYYASIVVLVSSFTMMSSFGVGYVLRHYLPWTIGERSRE